MTAYKKLALEWLKRAKSNFERAKLGKISKDILFEDLCFDAQQTVEKALKALLIYSNIPFPRVHSIGRLLELLMDNGVDIPDIIKEATILTEYAVETRYPGEYGPVNEEEYEKALNLAEIIFNWVTEKLKETQDCS